MGPRLSSAGAVSSSTGRGVTSRAWRRSLVAEMLVRVAALGDPEDRSAQPPAKAEGST